MVASGVPIPNGNHHVEEIAKMALDLLAKDKILNRKKIIFLSNCYHPMKEMAKIKH
jgi:hypothetical protein